MWTLLCYCLLFPPPPPPPLTPYPLQRWRLHRRHTCCTCCSVVRQVVCFEGGLQNTQKGFQTGKISAVEVFGSTTTYACSCCAGKVLGGVWEVCGRYVGGVWEVCGRCVGGMWEVCGRCVGGMWEVYRRV